MFEHDALKINLKYLLNFFLTYLHLNLTLIVRRDSKFDENRLLSS